MNHSLPFARSYWVEPGRLLAGFYPGDLSTVQAEEKINRLLDVGMRCFINLVEEDELHSYYHLLRDRAAHRQIDITYMRIPVRDLDVPSRATMTAILDAIDASLARDCPVYVHCWGGVGRTGTVVGCYLARRGEYVGAAALARIADLRRLEPTRHRVAPETAAQRAIVLDWPAGN